MIKILIVDDNQSKIKSIRDIFERKADIEIIETATNVIQTKRNLKEKYYDLVVLDLALPLRDGDIPNPQNGIDLLDEINKSEYIKKPAQIIGLSEFDEYIESFRGMYENELWALIKYSPNSIEWETKIINKVDYLINFKNTLLYSSVEYNYDLAIVTALRSPELESILNIGNGWKSFRLPNDSTEYHKICFNNGNVNINIVAACAPQMGMVAATSLTSKMIVNFRPKYVAMTGIAGGVNGVGNLGDILVAEFAFDSGSGKISTAEGGERIFLPDFRQVEIDVDFKEMFVSLKGTREFLNEIKEKWPIKNINHDLNIHLGPFASGAGVISNDSVIQDIKSHARKLVGIDMETYGVYYACKNATKPKPKAFFSIKSISDFGDSKKDDRFQEYASYTSASFLEKLILFKLDFE